MTDPQMISALEFIGERHCVVTATQGTDELTNVHIQFSSDEPVINLNDVRGTVDENGIFIAKVLANSWYAGHPINSIAIISEENKMR